MTSRSAAEAFVPGEYLRDELEARSWTQTEFAQIIGRPPRVVNEIIAGKRSISPETANELAAALGTSAQLWMNLESAYQLSRAKPASEAIAHHAMLRERFPVREMAKRGWIRDTTDIGQLQSALRKFFQVSRLDEDIRFPHAARRSGDGELSKLQLAWLFRVKQIADALPSVAYSHDSLRAALKSLELLTTEPEEARHVPRILGECGVRFVVVEPFPGSRIDGVCFWTDNNRSPVIGLTLRFDRNDNFWFVLRHEIEHVLREDAKSGLIVDEDVGDATRDMNDAERRADEAAIAFCVSDAEMSKFISRVKPYFSEAKLVGFARRIGRHPGIVVGQLQHRLGRHDLLNKLKAKIRSHVIGAALTDGWGVTVDI
jgi:HTH-type transcriptional regulator / antitoxin HigA